MNQDMMIELFGYLGSAIVLVSFLMTSVFKLRIVNTIGSVIFMTYAVIIHSYPTAIMNLCLVLINLHFLWKMRHTGNKYEMVKVNSEDEYLQYLLQLQKSDIDKCFPGLHVNQEEVTGSYILTCDAAPAGILLIDEIDSETSELILDYSLPQYRDFSLGTYLMKKLKESGIKKLVYKGPTENHMAYLNKMGFKESNGAYEKIL